MTGIGILLEMLASTGVRFIFGNPGTTELPLSDALARDRRFQYVLGLHEIPVMGMADGYAMASRALGVVNLHIGCGLGNAMGMLYNAFTEGTPLLITAGQQDRRLRMDDPVLATELVNVAKPWTKWAYEVTRIQDLPTILRRAIQTALSPPTGPVFLALPVDLQLESCTGLDLTPPRVPDRRVRPPAEALAQAAKLLAGAKNPVILAGSRVTDGGAIGELVAVAELLGAPVFSESATAHGRVPFPPAHPLYACALPLWSPDVRKRLEGFDVALATGTSLLRTYVHQEPTRALPENLKIVQLDEDPWQLGKTYPVEVGLVGDTKTGLAELHGCLQQAMLESQVKSAKKRGELRATEHQKARTELEERIAAEKLSRPMMPLALMGALARVLPSNVAVVEEATTTTNGVFERLGVLKDPSGYFGHRGWSLGWGMGVALGVKLAWPDRPVLAIIGDGAAMYGIQALWSAAHYQIPVTFVIANNRQYRILKHCADVMPLPEMAAGRFVGMDLTKPEIDFVSLARSLGVEAERLETPDAVSTRVSETLSGDKPTLFEVPLKQ